MSTVRNPAVAGMFYPADPRELDRMVTAMLAEAPAGGEAPKALIAPHAGYIYSGPVAASVYARLRGARDTIERVVLLGPSHRVGFYGLAVPSTDVFRTPLGDIPIDTARRDQLLELPQVVTMDQAHAMEHSLEVQLPFLQELLTGFLLLPVVVGDAPAQEVAEVLERVWGGPETLIVVSSDLSHYHDYDTARRMDTATSEAIVALQPERLGHEDACGRVPVSGLLLVARSKGLQVEMVDLRNSGDTAGPRDQVVGYGAYAFSESQ
jgi:AmmeMemoRadiSam system protein B